MGKKLDQAVSVAIFCAAIAVGASVVYRTFFQRPPVLTQSDQPPEFVDFWKTAFDVGSSVAGDSNAAITIVELTDLECPFCRALQQRLDSVLANHPHDVRLLYVPYPLATHRFANAAAQAAECAAGSGELRHWIDAVYAKQDSLGLKSWSAFAEEAGITDAPSIEKCAKSPVQHPHIVGGLEFGAKIKLTATPTVMINGWKYFAPPSREEIEKAIRTLMEGKTLADAQ